MGFVIGLMVGCVAASVVFAWRASLLKLFVRMEQSGSERARRLVKSVESKL